ncbi:MAG: hypothetical protein ACYSUK_00110 [Planctomycetota bacterium]|jgi:hypothetical protein
MNIVTPMGDTVTFSCPEAGYPEDIIQAAKFLTEGESYIVAETYPGSQHSYVELMEFPGEYFNTVMFENE